LDIEDQEHDNIPTENAKNQQDVMHELISDTNSRIIYARKRVSSGQQIEADEMRATTKRASSGQQIEADERGLLLKEPHQASKLRQTK
jgi:hypothetical protein